MCERSTSRGVAVSSLFIACVSLFIPAAAAADTPLGTMGGMAPEPGPLDSLLGVVVPIAVLAFALGVVLLLAFVLARLGTSTSTGTESGDLIQRTSPRSERGRIASLVLITAVGVVGVAVGREIAYAASAYSFLGGVVEAGVTLVTVIVLVVVAVLALVIRRGRMTGAIGTTFASATLLAAGALAGHATAAATGGLYREPVVLTTSTTTGESGLLLRDGGQSFVAHGGGHVECSSAPDSHTVASVATMDLGLLGGHTLRGYLSVPHLGSDEANANFYVDAVDLPEGSIEPMWAGNVRILTLASNGTSGTMAFDSFPWLDPTAKYDPSAALPPVVGDWPATLSGSFSWNCGPWH